MSDTPRTDKATRLRGSLFFVETVVSESLERELNAAKAEVAQRTAERDEARRELCELRSRLGADYYVPSLNPEGYAKARGWDCFDAPHATDGRVQNGGA
jgi:hypothetical protein